jgi:hypothetical protein
MPAHETIASLAQRKAELLRRSHEHRQALAAEAAKLRPLADWVDLGITTVKQVRKGWEIAGPLLAAWRGNSDPGAVQAPSGTFQKISSAISLVRSVAALWRK